MISAVVCAYNRASILRRMLESFFQQNYLNEIEYELIVVDNNSSDGTRRVVGEYLEHPQCRYIFEERQGLSVARNRGGAEGKGDIVAFLDDDVIVDKDWLKRLQECFEETKADVVGGRVYLIVEKEPPKWLGPEFRMFLSLGKRSVRARRFGRGQLGGKKINPDNFQKSLVDPFQYFGIQIGDGAGCDSPVVDGADLVDEQIGIAGQLLLSLDPDAEWFCIVDEIRRKGNDDRRGMARIQKGLILQNENGSGFSRLRPFLRVEVCQPDRPVLKSRGHVPPR